MTAIKNKDLLFMTQGSFSVVVEKFSCRDLQAESHPLWSKWRALPPAFSPDWFVNDAVVRSVLSLRPPREVCWVSWIVDAAGGRVGVFLLTPRWKCMWGVLPVRYATILRSGNKQQDQWWPEYVQPRCAPSVHSRIGWWFEQTLRQMRLFSLEIEVAPVDWSKRWQSQSDNAWVVLEQQTEAYQRVLSADMEWGATIRRYCRQTERYSQTALGGVLRLEEAAPSECFSYFKEYGHWHCEKWQGSDTPSGYDNPIFVRQWERLFQQENPVARVFFARAYQQVVGIAVILDDGYWCGFYLSSLKPFPSNHWHLGVWMHVKIMELLSAQGRGCYDFMAGEASYKKRLGNDDIKHAKATWIRGDNLLSKAFAMLKKHIFSCNIIKHK